MDDNVKLKAVKERFLKFILQEKRSNNAIFIDCNPSSSFLTLCALHAATHVLVPVRPDRFSMLGLEILAEFIETLPTLSPKPQLLIVLKGFEGVEGTRWLLLLRQKSVRIQSLASEP
jgi:chromosome partitioning protein